MKRRLFVAVGFFAVCFRLLAGPVIDPISNVTIPAGKSLILPVTASSSTGRPLQFTAASTTNRIVVEIHTNNPFWKMSVAQVASSNAPGAFQTPFRGGIATVTNVGDMTFMLFRNLTPHTVDVLQGLTAGGMYTSNTIFHRVVPGFVIQGGDPLTNGFGGPVFRYDDEFNPHAIYSGNGQLALANSGKDTDGSQFFITLGPQRFLDFGYTLCGQLIRGFNVMTNIANTPTNGNSRPLSDVIITKTSIVPDPFDTVLTLSCSNTAGVVGTISVIADDGAGGRTTNLFAATTVTDSSNDQPFIYPQTVTNLVAPLNGRLTNIVSALDLDGDTYYWFPYTMDSNATNSTVALSGTQLRLTAVPNQNFTGTAGFIVYVSSSSLFNTAPLGTYPYDSQVYTFAFGDTPISAAGTSIVANAGVPFTNLLIATFTNGVPNSPSNAFSTFVNWGDNVTNAGVVVTNLSGWKGVYGSHTYTNAGTYPIYLTIQSVSGANATVISMGNVPPTLTLTQSGNSEILSWPAWAIDYQLQSQTNVAATPWSAPNWYPTLVGYNNVLTNGNTGGNAFFRLKK